tara:strand:- start:393 stop:524 length:132 start_codon:yes stop_codon:yes gene_type:complete
MNSNGLLCFYDIKIKNKKIFSDNGAKLEFWLIFPKGHRNKHFN